MEAAERCEPCDIEAEWRKLDALAVVDTVRTDVIREKQHQQRESHRVICTLHSLVRLNSPTW